MKKILLLLVIFISISAQSWNSTVSLFQVPTDSKVSSLADENGIHIVYYTNSVLKYARVNSSGTTQVSDKTIDTGSDIGYAKINSIEGNLFVTYYKASKIRIEKSTNLGVNWTSNFSSRAIENTGFNALDTYVTDWALHIAWSERRIGGTSSQNDVHYVKFNTQSPAWSNYKRVTDTESYGGVLPNVVVSDSRVHIVYYEDLNKYEFHNRDMIISTNQWQAVQNIPYNSSAFMVPNKFVYIDNDYLRVVHKYTIFVSWDNIYEVGQSYRSLTGSTWTNHGTSFETNGGSEPVSIQTSDNKVHLFYYDAGSSSTLHKTISGTTWTTIGTFSNPFSSICFAGNDLFRIEYYWVNHSLIYQQYDAIPPKPLNLIATSSANDHPYITWGASICADFKEYKVYKRNHPTSGSWTLIATTSNSYYEDQTETIVTGPLIANEKNVYYAVREVDQSNNYSSYSDMLTVRVEGPPLNKISSDGELSLTYELSQNYPNPFNPSTKIQFQIPEDGFVSLIVYNTLGEKVITLVN